MSEVETKGRRALAGMFGGEQVVFGNDFLGTFAVEDPRELEQDIKQLPNEIVLYLHSLTPHLPEFVSDLISELLESLEEKEARRRLWERFGLPKSTLAVPVFKQLSEDLSEVQDDVVERSQDLQALARGLISVIGKISLFYAELLNRLEEDEQAHAIAIGELSSIDVRGGTMRAVTFESVIGFEAERQALAVEKKQVKAAQTSWQQRVREWLERLPLLRSFETPIDLGSPDPAMAL